MKKMSAKLSGVLAGASLYAVAVPALAQDSSAGAKPKSDRDAAVETMPTWESYGAGEPESQEETFFRLSRDFVTSSDMSIQRLGSVPIWPRGELKIFGLRLMPYLRQAVQWDDNYYKQSQAGNAPNSKGRDSVWTHISEVGVLGDAALMGGRLTLATSIVSTWNQRYGNDSAPDTWDFNGQVGATYTSPQGAWVAGGLTYERRHDPADIPLYSNDFGRNRSGAFLHFGLNRDIFFGTKLRFEFGVDSSNYVAHDNTYNAMDRTETVFYGKVSYPFLKNDTARVFVLAREKLMFKDYSGLNDGKSFGMSVGMDGSIPIRDGEYRGIRGQVSVGFDSALYDNNTYTAGSQTIVNDTNNRNSTTANVQVALNYVMSPKSTADLRYIHDAEFSFYGNYQVVDHVQFTFSHNFTRQLTGRFQAFYEHTNPNGQSPQASIPSNTISQGANNVNREGAGLGLRYAINEWMDVDLTANVENRNDHTVNSFRNYSGILGLTFYLNALVPQAQSSASAQTHP